MPDTVAVPENQAPPGEYTLEEILERSVHDAKFFDSLCRLLLTRSVLFALEGPVPPAGSRGSAENFSIKVLNENDSEGLPVALIFSSKAALAAAGEKFGWQKNQKGMYSFAALNGQAAFGLLRGNGYNSSILDAASPKAVTWNSAQMSKLADGKIPEFDPPT